MGAYISLPSWWRTLDQRYRLVLGKCPECGEYNFPADGACAGCNSLETFEEVEAAGTGTVVSRTVVENSTPPEFAAYLDQERPIGVAIVELDEGVRVPTMLVDCDPYEITAGDTVKAVVRRIYNQEGIVRYGFKFRPVEP